MTLDIPRRILGIIDIVIGITILIFPNVTFLKFLIFFALVKGIVSLLGSIAAGFWFDVMGALDILAALTLIGIFNGWYFFVYPIVGVGMIIKGIISIV